VKISRHIHYLQNPDSCIRYELTFDPPLDVESTLGKIDPLYPNMESSTEKSPKRIEKTANVINKNGLLHLSEVMKPGETLSIDLRSGFRLDKLVIGEEQVLQIYVGKEGLTYAVTIGKRGAIEVTGRVIEDKESYHSKLHANLDDTAFREYLVKLTLTDSIVAERHATKPPDYLTAEESWAYLRIGRTKFFQLVKMGKIKRGPNNRYSKKVLEQFFESESD
jgi:hypothetical protein